MFQESSGQAGWLREIRDSWQIIVFGGAIALALLRAKLSRFFPTRRELKKGIGDVRDDLKEEIRRIDRLEQFSLTANDRFGVQEKRLNDQQAEIKELRQYGSDPSRQLSGEVMQLRLILVEMQRDIKYMREAMDR